MADCLFRDFCSGFFLLKIEQILSRSFKSFVPSVTRKAFHFLETAEKKFFIDCQIFALQVMNGSSYFERAITFVSFFVYNGG